MDYGIVLKTIGVLLVVESGFMLPSLLIAAAKGQGDFVAFLVTFCVTLTSGVLLFLRSRARGRMLRYREGFMTVGLGWIAVSFFGALPFVFSGALPNLMDAFFESVSGFTTTGATVIADIEILPHALLFWRSLTHWLGGMGILVFTIILLPSIGGGVIRLFRAESPGPSPDKIVPRLRNTAIILYGIYLVFTLAQILLLWISGMTLFEAATHTFATMGTGGFSTRNSSIGAFDNSLLQWVIILFMAVAGVNFALYFDAFLGKFKTLLGDPEFRFYALVIMVTGLLVTVNVQPLYGSVSVSLRQAFFQVTSIVTTTGFTTANYELWPQFSQMLLFLLMFFGGSAGSTGGAIKQIRILIVLKYIRRELAKLVHPKAVIAIRIGDRPVPEDTVEGIMGFVLLYIAVFAVTSLFLMSQGMDILSGTAAVAATLGNVGPGFGMVGPTSTYAGLTMATKLMLSFCMLLGRLELYTILALFVPSFWKR